MRFFCGFCKTGAAIRTFVLLAQWLAALPLAFAGNCDQPLEWYQGQSFVVREVLVNTPLQFLPSVRGETQRYVDAIPLKAGAAFDVGLFNAGLVPFQSAFRPLNVGRYSRLAVRVVPPPTIQNCDVTGRSLDAVYAAYTMNIGGVLSSLFETQSEVGGRSVPDTGVTRFFRAVQPAPFIGYDPARHLFGGTRLDVRPGIGPIDRARFEVAGSGASLIARADLTGSRDIKAGPIRNVEYTLAYDYAELPAQTGSIRNAKLAAQVITESAPLGSSDSIFRVGGSVDGGHSQTGFDPASIRAEDVPNAGVGSVKLFAGWSGVLGGNPAKASYGLQLGKTGPGAHVDFAKHLVNVEYAARFLPAWHRAITLDTAFSAGKVQELGRVPVGERFFGGNQAPDFVSGSTWSIPDNPIVRSLPVNRLTRFGATGLVGGDAFAAVNVTAGFTVWGRALVPDLILRTPKFDKVIDFQLSGAKASLYDSYLSEKPAFEPLRKATLAARDQLKAVSAALVEIGAPARLPGMDDDLKDALTVCANKTAKALDPILDKLDNEMVPTDAIGLFQDLPPEDVGDVAVPSKLQSLTASLKNLLEQLTGPEFDAQRDALSRVVTAWDSTLPGFSEAIKGMDTTPDAAAAKLQAQNEMQFPTRILHRLLYDVNLVGLSPVVLFDAARLWQSANVSTSESRYALGGGLKFSFVSLDLTLAYAVNPRRKLGEPVGAFVFSLNLADLFR